MRELIQRRLAVFGCYLDESDPDIVVLRRQQDGSFVAAFSAMSATEEGIVEAAREDYRILTQEPARSPSKEGKEQPIS